MNPPARRLTSAGLVSTLATVTGWKIGLAEVPAGIVRDAAGKLIDPYGIVYPLPGLAVHPTLADPDRAADWAYQLTSVGGRQDQAQRMADDCRVAVLARNPNGGFTNPIAVGAGLAMIDRRSSTLGGPEPAGGDLWQVVDIFHLEVDNA